MSLPDAHHCHQYSDAPHDAPHTRTRRTERDPYHFTKGDLTMKALLLFVLTVLTLSGAGLAINPTIQHATSAASPQTTMKAVNAETDDAHRRGRARALVNKRINSAWLLSKTCEPLNLILLDADERGRVYEAQLSKVFPEGRAHLPETLTPRVIYCRTAACERAIQYLGREQQDGFKFVVMRFYPTADEMQRIGCKP